MPRLAQVAQAVAVHICRSAHGRANTGRGKPGSGPAMLPVGRRLLARRQRAQGAVQTKGTDNGLREQ